MDKRTLIFALCLGLSFFGINAYFDRQNATDKKIALEASAQKAEREKKEREALAAKKRASLSELPLIAFYAAEGASEKIAYASTTQNGLIAIAWTDRLPATVYTTEFGPLELSTHSHKIGEPVVYSKGKPKVYVAPSIAEDALLELQLLTLANEPRIVVGQQRGSDFALPYESLHENAIAFLKSNGKYAPVGLFEASTQKVRLFADYERLRPLVQQTYIPAQRAPLSDEQYYILENEYQQLVFTTRGGALAEINLPLHTKNNKSLVNPVEADTLILEQSPANGQFPLFPASAIDANGQTYTKNPAPDGYYPLLRRPLLDSRGEQKQDFDPQYYALNIVSDHSDTASLSYRVTRFEKNLIQFEASDSMRRITKTFAIPESRNGPYCFTVSVQIDGDARGLWLTSGVPDVELVSGSFTPLLRYQVTHNKTSDVETIDLSDKHPALLVTTLSPNWISNSNGFLGLILDPLNPIGVGYRATKIPGASVPTRLSLIDAANQLYPIANYPGFSTALPLRDTIEQTFRVFAGPYDESLLKELDALYEDPTQNYNPEYIHAQSIQGWFSFISQPFAKFLSLLIGFFYLITHSWGFSIILLTIALRLMMYPLNNWSIRSTLKMQEIAPKIKAVQERHKKDPKKAQMEVMNLYREQGINPFSGCFPILLQMPFLIGMFYLLKSSFPLRGAPFIPGWINDLSAPDVLFTWGYSIPFIGTEFHLLPILLGLTMFIQQRMTAKTPKDGTLSDSQKQQKTMGNLMSIVFTVMFYGFPSGLNIYFISSNLLGMLQQYYLTKKVKGAPTLALKK